MINYLVIVMFIRVIDEMCDIFTKYMYKKQVMNKMFKNLEKSNKKSCWKNVYMVNCLYSVYINKI